MRPAFGAVLLAAVLAGCGGPVFVPEAGPGAPGYTETSAPGPPDAEVVEAAAGKPSPAGGVIDSVVRDDESFEVTGWALIDPKEPRGLLQLVLPGGLDDATVLDVETVPRPDVVDATGDAGLLWAGFTVTVRGTLPEQAAVCVLSRSTQGAFRLGGSDEGLCPV